VNAAVRTFAAANGRAEALLPLTKSAIASLIEHLLDLAGAPLPQGHAEGRVGELEAIASALDQRPRDAM
jgi:hypothetical protein